MSRYFCDFIIFYFSRSPSSATDQNGHSKNDKKNKSSSQKTSSQVNRGKPKAHSTSRKGARKEIKETEEYTDEDDSIGIDMNNINDDMIGNDNRKPSVRFSANNPVMV